MANVTEMTKEQLMARIAELEANNAPKALKIAKSDKGGVMVLGLNSFPVTLYANQWQRLAEVMPKILKFIEDNKAILSWK